MDADQVSDYIGQQYRNPILISHARPSPEISRSHATYRLLPYSPEPSNGRPFSLCRPDPPSCPAARGREEPIYGLAMIEELARHGYKLSAGTLYPILHRARGEGIPDLDRGTDGQRRAARLSRDPGRQERTLLSPKSRCASCLASCSRTKHLAERMMVDFYDTRRRVLFAAGTAGAGLLLALRPSASRLPPRRARRRARKKRSARSRI